MFVHCYDVVSFQFHCLGCYCIVEGSFWLANCCNICSAGLLFNIILVLIVSLYIDDFKLLYLAFLGYFDYPLIQQGKAVSIELFYYFIRYDLSQLSLDFSFLQLFFFFLDELLIPQIQSIIYLYIYYTKFLIFFCNQKIWIIQ